MNLTNKTEKYINFYIIIIKIISLLQNNKINWRILLNLYKRYLLVFLARAGIRNKPGIKKIPNGSNKDVAKLKKVSLIKWIWVFEYIAQNIDI